MLHSLSKKVERIKKGSMERLLTVVVLLAALVVGCGAGGGTAEGGGESGGGQPVESTQDGRDESVPVELYDKQFGDFRYHDHGEGVFVECDAEKAWAHKKCIPPPPGNEYRTAHCYGDSLRAVTGGDFAPTVRCTAHSDFSAQSSVSAGASSSAVANEQGDIACAVDGMKIGRCQAPEEWDSGSEPYVLCEARTRAAVVPGKTPCRPYN